MAVDGCGSLCAELLNKRKREERHQGLVSAHLRARGDFTSRQTRCPHVPPHPNRARSGMPGKASDPLSLATGCVHIVALTSQSHHDMGQAGKATEAFNANESEAARSSGIAKHRKAAAARVSSCIFAASGSRPSWLRHVTWSGFFG